MAAKISALILLQWAQCQLVGVYQYKWLSWHAESLLPMEVTLPLSIYLVCSVKCSLVSINIWGKGRFPLVGLRGLLDRSVTMSDTPTKVTEDMGS